MKKLLGEARAAKASVVYSIIANTTTADVIKDVAPTADEPWVRSGLDKFFNTDLDKMLKDRASRRSLPLEPHRTERCCSLLPALRCAAWT
jgi:hypothetical protein